MSLMYSILLALAIVRVPFWSPPAERVSHAALSASTVAIGVTSAHSDTYVWSGSDSAEVARVVESFHAALAAGDSVGALQFLAPDAVIQESGGAETRADYARHHLPGDIEFARAVPSTRGAVRVVVAGDVAWSSATSTTKGTYRGRTINAVGAELMVLSRSGGGWRIRAIHWSSRTPRSS